MPGFQQDDATDEQIAREVEVFGDLAQSVRELIEATIRSEVDDEIAIEAAAEIRAITERVRARQMDGGYGIRFRADGKTRPFGNAVIGVRNAIAPPLDFVRDREHGRASADFFLGAQYEGPPTLVHGGVAALILDQACGEAAGAAGSPGMTASLTLQYRRPTPLGQLRAEAWVEKVEDHKTLVRGYIADAEGVCVQAEGLFVLPRWARQHAGDQTTAMQMFDRFE